MLTWRPMAEADIPIVYQLSLDQWAPNYYESEETFLNKFITSPSTCYMYQNEGYILSHPYNSAIIPTLNEPLQSVPINCHFIHDIVLIPKLRGQRIADNIIEYIISQFPIVTLAASNDMQVYWKRFGFIETDIECNYGKHMIKWN